MLQVRIHGPNDARIDDVETPEPGPRDAVVQVAACGICGTDTGFIKAGGLMGPTRHPMPIGHEIAGTISRIGAEAATVTGLNEGDRVVVHPGGTIGNGGRHGGLGDFVLAENAAAGDRLVRIPDSMPFTTAALAEPLGVGMHAVEQADVRPGDKVAIFGAGPIGLSALAALRDRGLEDVAVVDLSPTRLALAEQFGAAILINATTDDVWERLAVAHGTAAVLGMPMAATDAYIEASGAPTVIPDLINHAKKSARLSIVALHHEQTPVSFLVVLFKELTIRGSMEYPEDFASTVELLQRHDLSTMVTHTYALPQFHDALHAMSDGDCGKVMITMEQR